MTNHFFIVGAQRCGTTYLYNLLDEHPEIEMAKPVKPEPKFFMKDDLFEKGLDFYKEKLGRPHQMRFGAYGLYGQRPLNPADSKVATRD